MYKRQAWNRGRIDALDEAFGKNVCSLDDKPTNGEFIAVSYTHLIDRGKGEQRLHRADGGIDLPTGIVGEIR